MARRWRRCWYSWWSGEAVEGLWNGKINRGKSVQVRFDLTRRDLSIWDTVAQKRQLRSGSYNVYVGSSSRNLPLMGTFTI
jgi:beta-glucosidase